MYSGYKLVSTLVCLHGWIYERSIGMSSQNEKGIRNHELAWPYWCWSMYVSMWDKLKFDWSQHSYLENIQAKIKILKKWYSMDA